VAKHRNAPPAAPGSSRRPVSEGKQKFVAIWSKAWGLIGAIIVVFVAARLPDTLKAGDGAQLLRDFGLLLICFNLIMQATKSDWPMFYALPLTVFGISVWLVGWFA
jgi:hypothetical protein